MLLDLDPGVKALHCVVRLDRNGSLGDYGPVIDLLVNEVDCDTGDLDTLVQSLHNGVRARKRR